VWRLTWPNTRSSRPPTLITPMSEPNPETIEAQLAAHRRTLADLLEQAASVSAGQRVAAIAHDIDAAHAEVERLKATLASAALVADEATIRRRERSAAIS
jgi:hypothetical protein